MKATGFDAIAVYLKEIAGIKIHAVLNAPQCPHVVVACTVPAIQILNYIEGTT